MERAQGACCPQRPPDGGARDTGLGLLNHAVLWLLFQGPLGANPVSLRILTLGVKRQQGVVKFFRRRLLQREREIGGSGRGRETPVPSSGWRQGTPKGALRGSMAVGPGFPTVLPHPCFTPPGQTQHNVPGIRPGHGAGGCGARMDFEIINRQVRKTRVLLVPGHMSDAVSPSSSPAPGPQPLPELFP